MQPTSNISAHSHVDGTNRTNAVRSQEAEGLDGLKGMLEVRINGHLQLMSQEELDAATSPYCDADAGQAEDYPICGPDELMVKYEADSTKDEDGRVCTAEEQTIEKTGASTDPERVSDRLRQFPTVAAPAGAISDAIRIKDATDVGGWDRVWGGVKMVGGALETVAGGALVAAGAATSEIGIGIPIAAAGTFVAAHGADVTVSGARTMWNDEPVDTLTSQGLQELGMSRGAANLTDAGISVVGSLGSGFVTRAPGAVVASEEVLRSGDDVARAVAGGAHEATSSVSIAFKPGLPTGHNMVGVTTEGTTTWSHLVVGQLDEVSGGMSRVATAGTEARVLASTSGPSSAYVTATVPVTSAEAQAARSFAQSAEAASAGTGLAGTYSYLGNNCTTYATSVLREAGVVAPSASTPATAFATVALQSPDIVQPIAAAGIAANTSVMAEAGYDYIEPDYTPAEPMQSVMPTEEPMSSYNEDPSEQVCTADGY